MVAQSLEDSYVDVGDIVYLLNRYYDPSTDQFLSIDPDVAETGQPYVYTNDDPLNSADPLGLRPDGSSASMSTTLLSYKPTVQIQIVGALGKTLSTSYSAETLALEGPGGSSIKVTSAVTVIGPGSASKVSVSSDGNVSVAVGSSTASFSSAASFSLVGSSASYSYSGSQSLGHGSSADTVNVNVTVSYQQGNGSGTSGFTLNPIPAVGTILSYAAGAAWGFFKTCGPNPFSCGLDP
jgi:RHS repeat-associated protein